ncbi:MAG: nuclear transport factor 2 family protein [Actinoplanes sp.]
MSGPIEAVLDLSAAFQARDLAAAMACFVPGEDVGYAGSELTERAAGRDALTALLGGVFTREEAYGWRVGAATVHEYGTTAYVYAEADGLVRTDAGAVQTFPYRVSGLVERIDGRWLWRHCQGCEPVKEDID